jgi:hypothetical protein
MLKASNIQETHMLRNPTLSAVCLCILMSLSGCGGGNSSAEPSTNQKPVALAGQDLKTAVNTLVTLDGTKSTDPENDTLSYSWTLTGKPEGSQAALSSADTARPTFTPDLVGAYRVRLVVSDAQKSDPVELLVTAFKPTPSLSALIGSESFPQDWPYRSSQNGMSIGCPDPVCTSSYALAKFRLAAQDQNFTITDLAAVSLTAGSNVQPTFEKLVNNQVVRAGESVEFELSTPSTSSQEVSLKYSFRIAETGQNFEYSFGQLRAK